ncbi:hypothetical protein K8R43_05025 [archaeon]|nr:hypothetical protein [archaeon]
MNKKLKGFAGYFRILAIPLVVIIFWSIIVFAVGVAGALSVDVAGLSVVGASLAILGSIIGSLMAVLVGFNAAKEGTKKITRLAVMGTLFGLITGAINSILAIATSLFAWITDTSVTSGLQGISPSLIVSFLKDLQVLGPEVEGFIDIAIVMFGSLLVLASCIITGAILAIIGGIITNKFLK